MTKIVSEIGWNHMGDMDLAEKMIKSCSENGADYAKFQTWSVKRLKYVKIASFDSDNIDLLKFCNDNFETMFISTGTKTVDEVKSSVSRENIPDAKIIVLHCISSYPLEPKNVNLPRINSFKKIYDKVGYSDHTFGVETTKAALEYDIDIVEKHFTLDRDLPGRDNKFAILPHEMLELTNYIKMREEMNISHGDGYLECEQEARDVMTGRFDG